MKFGGIDPGKHGGIGLITKSKTAITISIQKIPQKNFRLHVPEFVEWININKPDVIGIEELGCYALNSRISIQTAAIAWGKMISLIEHLKVPYQIYKPKAWHSLVNVSQDHRDIKDRTIARAKELYPQVDLIPKGSRNDQDGLADALLIAHATMTQYIGNLSYGT